MDSGTKGRNAGASTTESAPDTRPGEPADLPDVPAFFQHDWPETPYGSLGSLAEWGCGPTCFAMVASYLGSPVVTPADAAGAGDVRGRRLTQHFGTSGTAWTYYADAEECFGIPHSDQTGDASAVLDALAHGQVAICSQAPGVFTTSGHLIVLRGLDRAGMIWVRDPWKPHTDELGYNTRPFKPEEVFSTMRQCWVYPKREKPRAAGIPAGGHPSDTARASAAQGARP